MQNILDAIGYANEKLHTGMIEYLCDLFNSGEREPLRSFFEMLSQIESLTPPIIFEDDVTVEAVKESAWLDLVIRKTRNGKNEYYIGIEMKVDSHEHGSQTERYYENLHRSQPEMRHFFFITLGMGEYFLPPSSQHFRWVTLSKCLQCVNNIALDDYNIRCWRYMLERERVFRAYCQQEQFDSLMQFSVTNPTRKSMWRHRGWNLCFLGELSKAIVDKLPIGYIHQRDVAVYTCGSRPDTILNFMLDDCNSDGSYIEITNNGELSLKVNAKQRDGNPVDIQSILDRYKFETVVEDAEPTFSLPFGQQGEMRTSTKTVKRYAIGIQVTDGIMSFRPGETREAVAERLVAIALFFATHGIEIPAVEFPYPDTDIEGLQELLGASS